MRKIAKFALAATLVGGAGAPTAVFVADQASANDPRCQRVIDYPSGSFPLRSGQAYTAYGPNSGFDGKQHYNIKRIQREVGAPVDGYYGSKTASKVKSWQRSHGLSVDGKVGPKTWSKMARGVTCAGF